jgi:hypothetical protein
MAVSALSIVATWLLTASKCVETNKIKFAQDLRERYSSGYMAMN